MSDYHQDYNLKKTASKTLSGKSLRLSTEINDDLLLPGAKRGGPSPNNMLRSPVGSKTMPDHRSPSQTQSRSASNDHQQYHSMQGQHNSSHDNQSRSQGSHDRSPGGALPVSRSKTMADSAYGSSKDKQSPGPGNINTVKPSTKELLAKREEQMRIRQKREEARLKRRQAKAKAGPGGSKETLSVFQYDQDDQDNDFNWDHQQQHSNQQYSMSPIDHIQHASESQSLRDQNSTGNNSYLNSKRGSKDHTLNLIAQTANQSQRGQERDQLMNQLKDLLAQDQQQSGGPSGSGSKEKQKSNQSKSDHSPLRPGKQEKITGPSSQPRRSKVAPHSGKHAQNQQKSDANLNQILHVNDDDNDYDQDQDYKDLVSRIGPGNQGSKLPMDIDDNDDQYQDDNDDDNSGIDLDEDEDDYLFAKAEAKKRKLSKERRERERKEAERQRFLEQEEEKKLAKIRAIEEKSWKERVKQAELMAEQAIKDKERQKDRLKNIMSGGKSQSLANQSQNQNQDIDDLDDEDRKKKAKEAAKALQQQGKEVLSEKQRTKDLENLKAQLAAKNGFGPVSGTSDPAAVKGTKSDASNAITGSIVPKSIRGMFGIGKESSDVTGTGQSQSGLSGNQNQSAGTGVYVPPKKKIGTITYERKIEDAEAVRLGLAKAGQFKTADYKPGQSGRKGAQSATDEAQQGTKGGKIGGKTGSKGPGSQSAQDDVDGSNLAKSKKEKMDRSTARRNSGGMSILSAPKLNNQIKEEYEEAEERFYIAKEEELNLSNVQTGRLKPTSKKFARGNPNLMLSRRGKGGKDEDSMPMYQRMMLKGGKSGPGTVGSGLGSDVFDDDQYYNMQSNLASHTGISQTDAPVYSPYRDAYTDGWGQTPSHSPDGTAIDGGSRGQQMSKQSKSQSPDGISQSGQQDGIDTPEDWDLSRSVNDMASNMREEAKKHKASSIAGVSGLQQGKKGSPGTGVGAGTGKILPGGVALAAQAKFVALAKKGLKFGKGKGGSPQSQISKGSSPGSAGKGSPLSLGKKGSKASSAMGSPDGKDGAGEDGEIIEKDGGDTGVSGKGTSELGSGKKGTDGTASQKDTTEKNTKGKWQTAASKAAANAKSGTKGAKGASAKAKAGASNAKTIAGQMMQDDGTTVVSPKRALFADLLAETLDGDTAQDGGKGQKGGKDGGKAGSSKAGEQDRTAKQMNFAKAAAKQRSAMDILGETLKDHAVTRIRADLESGKTGTDETITTTQYVDAKGLTSDQVGYDATTATATTVTTTVPAGGTSAVTGKAGQPATTQQTDTSKTIPPIGALAGTRKRASTEGLGVKFSDDKSGADGQTQTQGGSGQTQLGGSGAGSGTSTGATQQQTSDGSLSKDGTSKPPPLEFGPDGMPIIPGITFGPDGLPMSTADHIALKSKKEKEGGVGGATDGSTGYNIKDDMSMSGPGSGLAAASSPYQLQMMAQMEQLRAQIMGPQGITAQYGTPEYFKQVEEAQQKMMREYLELAKTGQLGPHSQQTAEAQLKELDAQEAAYLMENPASDDDFFDDLLSDDDDDGEPKEITEEVPVVGTDGRPQLGSDGRPVMKKITTIAPKKKKIPRSQRSLLMEQAKAKAKAKAKAATRLDLNKMMSTFPGIAMQLAAKGLSPTNAQKKNADGSDFDPSKDGHRPGTPESAAQQMREMQQMQMAQMNLMMSGQTPLGGSTPAPGSPIGAGAGQFQMPGMMTGNDGSQMGMSMMNPMSMMAMSMGSPMGTGAGMNMMSPMGMGMNPMMQMQMMMMMSGMGMGGMNMFQGQFEPGSAQDMMQKMNVPPWMVPPGSFFPQYQPEPAADESDDDDDTDDDDDEDDSDKEGKATVDGGTQTGSQDLGDSEFSAKKSPKKSKKKAKAKKQKQKKQMPAQTVVYLVRREIGVQKDPVQDQGIQCGKGLFFEIGEGAGSPNDSDPPEADEDDNLESNVGYLMPLPDSNSTNSKEQGYGLRGLGLKSHISKKRKTVINLRNKNMGFSHADKDDDTDGEEAIRNIANLTGGAVLGGDHGSTKYREWLSGVFAKKLELKRASSQASPLFGPYSASERRLDMLGQTKILTKSEQKRQRTRYRKLIKKLKRGLPISESDRKRKKNQKEGLEDQNEDDNSDEVNEPGPGDAAANSKTSEPSQKDGSVGQQKRISATGNPIQTNIVVHAASEKLNAKQSNQMGKEKSEKKKDHSDAVTDSKSSNKHRHRSKRNRGRSHKHNSKKAHRHGSLTSASDIINSTTDDSTSATSSRSSSSLSTSTVSSTDSENILEELEFAKGGLLLQLTDAERAVIEKERERRKKKRKQRKAKEKKRRRKARSRSRRRREKRNKDASGAGSNFQSFRGESFQSWNQQSLTGPNFEGSNNSLSYTPVPGFQQFPSENPNKSVNSSPRGSGQNMSIPPALMNQAYNNNSSNNRNSNQNSNFNQNFNDNNNNYQKPGTNNTRPGSNYGARSPFGGSPPGGGGGGGPPNNNPNNNSISPYDKFDPFSHRLDVPHPQRVFPPPIVGNPGDLHSLLDAFDFDSAVTERCMSFVEPIIKKSRDFEEKFKKIGQILKEQTIKVQLLSRYEELELSNRDNLKIVQQKVSEYSNQASDLKISSKEDIKSLEKQWSAMVTLSEATSTELSNLSRKIFALSSEFARYCDDTSGRDQRYAREINRLHSHYSESFFKIEKRLVEGDQRSLALKDLQYTFKRDLKTVMATSQKVESTSKQCTEDVEEIRERTLDFQRQGRATNERLSMLEEDSVFIAQQNQHRMNEFRQKTQDHFDTISKTMVQTTSIAMNSIRKEVQKEVGLNNRFRNETQETLSEVTSQRAEVTEKLNKLQTKLLSEQKIFAEQFAQTKQDVEAVANKNYSLILDMQEQVRQCKSAGERTNKESRSIGESLELMITQKVERLKDALLITIEGQKKMNEQIVQQRQESEDQLDKLIGIIEEKMSAKSAQITAQLSQHQQMVQHNHSHQGQLYHGPGSHPGTQAHYHHNMNQQSHYGQQQAQGTASGPGYYHGGVYYPPPPPTGAANPHGLTSILGGPTANNNINQQNQNQNQNNNQIAVNQNNNQQNLNSLNNLNNQNQLQRSSVGTTVGQQQGSTMGPQRGGKGSPTGGRSSDNSLMVNQSQSFSYLGGGRVSDSGGAPGGPGPQIRVTTSNSYMQDNVNNPYNSNLQHQQSTSGGQFLVNPAMKQALSPRRGSISLNMALNDNLSKAGVGHQTVVSDGGTRPQLQTQQASTIQRIRRSVVDAQILSNQTQQQLGTSLSGLENPNIATQYSQTQSETSENHSNRASGNSLNTVNNTGLYQISRDSQGNPIVISPNQTARSIHQNADVAANTLLNKPNIPYATGSAGLGGQGRSQQSLLQKESAAQNQNLSLAQQASLDNKSPVVQQRAGGPGSQIYQGPIASPNISATVVNNNSNNTNLSQSATATADSTGTNNLSPNKTRRENNLVIQNQSSTSKPNIQTQSSVTNQDSIKDISQKPSSVLSGNSLIKNTVDNILAPNKSQLSNQSGSGGPSSRDTVEKIPSKEIQATVIGNLSGKTQIQSGSLITGGPSTKPSGLIMANSSQQQNSNSNNNQQQLQVQTQNSSQSNSNQTQSQSHSGSGVSSSETGSPSPSPAAAAAENLRQRLSEAGDIVTTSVSKLGKYQQGKRNSKSDGTDGNNNSSQDNGTNGNSIGSKLNGGTTDVLAQVLSSAQEAVQDTVKNSVISSDNENKFTSKAQNRWTRLETALSLDTQTVQQQQQPGPSGPSDVHDQNDRLTGNDNIDNSNMPLESVTEGGPIMSMANINNMPTIMSSESDTNAGPGHSSSRGSIGGATVGVGLNTSGVQHAHAFMQESDSTQSQQTDNVNNTNYNSMNIGRLTSSDGLQTLTKRISQGTATVGATINNITLNNQQNLQGLQGSGSGSHSGQQPASSSVQAQTSNNTSTIYINNNSAPGPQSNSQTQNQPTPNYRIQAPMSLGTALGQQTNSSSTSNSNPNPNNNPSNLTSSSNLGQGFRRGSGPGGPGGGNKGGGGGTDARFRGGAWSY